MTPIHLRPSTLDEIVFEGRNKAYGAFDLRQTYPTHVRRALGTALLLFAVLAAAPGIVRRLMPEHKVVMPPVEIEHDLAQVKFKPIDEPKPVTPPAAASGVRVPTQELATRVVSDADAKPKPEPTTTPPADALFSTTTTTGPGEISTDGLLDPNAVPGDGKSTLDISTPATGNGREEVFITAEKMPKFAGGDAAMVEFLRRNMHYPALALRNQVEGKVFVSFTVSATGEIVDVQILKGLGSGTDEEALRVVKKMPAWEPGAQNGHPVAVRYTLPITFHIGN